MDILFHTEEYVFSYRVAGICIQNGKILLHKSGKDPAFAFPGGHVTLGETNAETLRREFREEIGVDISIGELKWVGEIFFPMRGKPCHQICLYYMVDITSDNIPLDGIFTGIEQMEEWKHSLEFHWVPLDKLEEIELYPTNVVEFLHKPDDGVQHFIYRE